MRWCDSCYGAARLFGVAALVIAALTAGGCGDVHERSEFSSLVIGKSSEEVISKVGKPAAVDDSNPARVLWTFKRATFDLANQNREDGTTQVIFEPKGSDGRLVATDVKFVP